MMITLNYGMSKRPDGSQKAGRGYAGGLPQLVAAPLPAAGFAGDIPVFCGSSLGTMRRLNGQGIYPS